MLRGELGGVPGVVLTDRMACLRASVVANVGGAPPGLCAFAADYGFRPDFCEAADPESKGWSRRWPGMPSATCWSRPGRWRVGRSDDGQCGGAGAGARR